jgi:hypothetical protein
MFLRHSLSLPPLSGENGNIARQKEAGVEIIKMPLNPQQYLAISIYR